MANYLLTGAAGFIGARMTQMLLEAGHKVCGVDNLNNAYDVRIKTYRLNKLQQYPGFTFFKLDITDRSILEPTIFKTDSSKTIDEPFDAIINLAARAGVRQSMSDPWVYIDTNVTGTLNMLEFCRRRGIPKFILASTSSIYGANAPMPTSEEADSNRPLQSYAASKKGAEALCHAYHYLYNLDVTIFRYFTVYGPAGRPDMSMFRFVQWISEGRPLRLYGDGTQSRGFTYIDDIVRGTIAGLKPLGYEIINLGGHELITINDLIHMIETLIGKRAQIEQYPANPADMLANWANVDKAKKLLGWVPQATLQEGVRELINWYNVERSWASQINTN
jgi:nucleoside-diphosphate-sugar epimerase